MEDVMPIKIQAKALLSLLFLMPFLVVGHSVLAGESQGQERSQNEYGRYEGSRIISIYFSGSRKLEASRLLVWMGSQKPGASFHRDEFKSLLDRIRILQYSKEGYLKASFSEPAIEPVTGGIAVRINVTEGRRYRLGNISVEDAKALSADAVIGMMSLVHGEIINGVKINKGMDRIKKFYSDRGYIRANPDLWIDWHESGSPDEDGYADLTVRIDEDRQYFLQRVNFAGNYDYSDDWLKKYMLIKDGDVYRQELIDKSLKRLNGLGIFETINPEDVTVETFGDRVNRIYLTITVREKISR